MMSVNGLKRVCCPGGRRWLAVVVAVLAACGVGGVVPSAALAGSSSVPDWTKLAPATHPPARWAASMAYDAATRTAVLFGGDVNAHGTWTWNGTTWTQQHPATRPPARLAATMAYDAATGTVVMFGGRGSDGHFLDDTWTWNGTTWTQQHPASHPPAVLGRDATMAYDAATGTVVLLDGDGSTWTWDGTTWTQQHPAASPSVPAAEMAYDAATGTVVMFGGVTPVGGYSFDGTWTWDGSTWTKQAPATSPSARWAASMTYDAATGNIVLFGGVSNTAVYGSTWTWG
jgi:hypothetical protein